MRIIAGTWRGRKLAALGKGDEAARLRPTPDRVRESLFSMLTARDAIEGARVLDLFAGTGALGFEALSRGAVAATFVENGRVGQRLITENIRLLDAPAGLSKLDATRLGPCATEPFGLVFLDPPYGKGLGERALAALRDGGWLLPEALIVWEDGAAPMAPQGYALEDQRRYGASWITLLRMT